MSQVSQEEQWVQGKGVCAGGNPYTVQAGKQAFEAGGNAIDAAVAAQLMAMVAEPLLTGLGGGGIATIHHEGKTKVLDFFSTMPGISHQGPVAPLDHVEISFGPDTQKFSYGLASVATPGMIQGLWTLHKAGGRLPLPMLARWAADQAEKGLEVSRGLSRSIDALTVIIKLDDYLAPKFFDAQGQAVKEGHHYDLKEMSETLMRWAEGGPKALLSGAPLQDLFDVLGPFAPLGLQDILDYQVHWRNARKQEYNIGKHARSCIWTPDLPSQGGSQILALLRELQRLDDAQHFALHQAPFDPLDHAFVEWFADAMQSVEQKKGPEWPRPLLDEDHPYAEYWHSSSAGFTTHISTADSQGTLVGITSSLGETAGISVAKQGLILNNFLGETDVAPPHCLPKPGQRLFTMCAPTLIQRSSDAAMYMLGSGGSSRIRSVILHGIVYLLDQRWSKKFSINEVVRAARCHLEAGKLRVETQGRSKECMQKLSENWGDALIPFEGENLYFGGLHMSGVSPMGLLGAGDLRRSGSHIIV